MILTRSTRLSQPTGPVEVDGQNVYAAGIEFAYIPGLTRDLTGKRGKIQTVGAGTSFLNGTMVTPGTNRNNGLILATGALLGPMQNSTVLAIANTRAALIPVGGVETDGAIGQGGNALYSERAPAGNDIYKLGLAASAGPTLNAEFVYRNDGGNLLQQRVNIGSESADGRMLAIAAVKSGTAHSVYGNAVSSVGTFGSASSAFTNANIQRRIGSDVADASCAWNGKILLVAGWSRALSADEIAGLRDNPWQLFRPVRRRVYFDMGAVGGDVVLAGSSASQVNTSSSGAITQTHVLSGASVAQSNTSTSGAIGQSIILTGASVAQGNASTSGAVSQTHVLIGSNCQQANTSTSGAVVQTGDLIGANCAQVNTSGSGSISQTHVLSGASCTQPNTTTSGAVIIVSVVILTGANCAQGNTTTTGPISQSHVLIGAPVAIDHIATASSIVQTHILSGADCSQSNYSTTGSINQVVIPSQFVASAPAGVFSARAPAGEYSATVPAGIFKASI